MSGELLATAVKKGKFLVTAECKPPKGADAQRVQACASALGGIVDALYVPESEDGVRMSSLAGCSHVKASGAEPILSLLTRDLNRIALQSSLLGAASLGVKNILCITGRHQALTSSGTAKGVFDVDQIQFLQIADCIRQDGKSADGQSLDSPVDLVLGTDVNPFAEPLEMHLITLEKAVRAGADFVITTPVFDLKKFEFWMSRVIERRLQDRVRIVAAVMALSSADEATALSQKYSNIGITDAVINKLQAASDQRAAGTQMAKDTIEAIRKIDGVGGVHIMTGEDFELAAEIIKATGLSRS